MMTIVIPVYNRATIVERTLDSVAKQTARPLQLIVVDNNSTDNTRAVVQQWMARHASDPSLITTLLDEAQPGAAAARNRGLANVATEWMMFFDSDDEMLPEHIERAQQAIAKARGQLDIVGWEVSQQLADGSRRTGRFTTHDMLYNNIVHGIMSTQRYCVRTAFVRSVGGWDSTARVWNDWELGMRLLAANPRVAKVNGAPTVVINFTDASITGHQRDIVACEHTINLVTTDLQRAGKTRLLPWVDYRRALLAADAQRQGDPDSARRILCALTRQRSLLKLCARLNRFYPRGTYLLYKLFVTASPRPLMNASGKQKG